MTPQVDDTARLFKALGHPARLRVLAMLRQGELCVCQITAALGLAASTVSAHLAGLRRARLVTERKDGRWVHYALTDDAPLRDVLDRLWPRLADDPQVTDDETLLGALGSVPTSLLCRSEPAPGRPVAPQAAPSRSGEP